MPATPLPTRRIGSFQVSALGLGCMNLSHAYGTPPSRADFVSSARESLIVEYFSCVLAAAPSSGADASEAVAPDPPGPPAEAAA